MYSVGLAYFLWLISGCGALGFHRFYLGKVGTGILWMMTGGLGMIGSVYDFFTLPNQVREKNIYRAIKDGQMHGNANVNIGDSWRNVRDGQSRIVNSKESVERVILKLAKANKGIITASELALSGNIPIEEAKKDLDAMVTKGFAELRVRSSGVLVYTIPELMDQNEPLVD